MAGRAFVDWFREDVLGLDSEEYRRAFWREAYRTGHTIGEMPKTMEGLVRNLADTRQAELGVWLFLIVVVGGASLAFWLLRKALDRYLRRTRRPFYYEIERGRRRRLAEARRAVQLRRTANDRPTVESIRKAFAHRGDSPVAALRLGALLQDLECYVDNHLIIECRTGRIRGRAGGIKRLLEIEAPDLFRRYKTLMSYKARAKKFRQACDAQDPVPVDALLPAFSEEPSDQIVGGVGFPFRPELGTVEALNAWMAEHGNTSVLGPRFRRLFYTPSHALRDESRELAAEILRGTEGTLVSLDAQIALKIDPDCVREDALPDTRVKILVPGQVHVPRRVVSYIQRRRRSA